MKTATIKIKGLRCDVPECTYEQLTPISNNYKEWKRWLNAPCPMCGASLLTEADLKTTRVMLWIINAINIICWPLTAVIWLFDKDYVTYDLGMDGSGKVNPKRVGEQKGS